PHSRQHETEADRIGMELMARAGYNPEAAVNVWRKMQAASKGSTPQFLSTHPSHSTRIKDLQALLPVVQPLYENALRNSRKQSNLPNQTLSHQPILMNSIPGEGASIFQIVHDSPQTRC
ncbi:MAG: M48 family metalloprotease, partial [Treponema sp.]|nr:M48 family metalloprotease [Treponema sp.]